MKVANIAEFKNSLSRILADVEKGEVIEIRKRNVPIARLVPLHAGVSLNSSRLGCGRGRVVVEGDLTEPMMPEESWEMLQG
jgi:prevent-host-death family protein